MIADFSDSERKRYLDGISLFNAHRFFEAHEVWEESWRGASGARREFYQGLIQCAVALEHYRRSNPRGVISLYATYRDHFRRVPDIFMGLNVARFLAGMHAAICNVVEASPPPGNGEITLDLSLVPTIELAGDLCGTGKAGQADSGAAELGVAD